MEENITKIVKIATGILSFIGIITVINIIFSKNEPSIDYSYKTITVFGEEFILEDYVTNYEFDDKKISKSIEKSIEDKLNVPINYTIGEICEDFIRDEEVDKPLFEE